MHISHKTALATLAALSALCSPGLRATEFYYGSYDEGSFMFSVIDSIANKVEVIRYSRTNGYMTIPETVYHEGISYSVVQIGEKAFDPEDNSYGPQEDPLISLSIPESVTTIKPYAFQNCAKLETINLPYNLSAIEEGVFSGCSSLTEINIPNQVKTLKSYAFHNCIALSNININPYCDLDTIEWGAFSNCLSLKEIYLPGNISYIRANAFPGCSALTDINIAPNMGFFSSNGILYTRDNALYIYPPGRQDSIYTTPNYLKLIDWFSFTENKFIQKVIISPGVERIRPHAFFECTSLEEVIIPETVKEIEYWAFSGCTSIDLSGNPRTNLRSLTLPASVDKLANYAVYDIPKLTVLNPEPPQFFKRPDYVDGSAIPKSIVCDTLFVPNASVEKYKAAENIDFKQIYCVEPLEGIKFPNDNISMFESDTDSLYIQTEPTYALCPPVKWAVSDTSVATISNDGKITATGAGTATVTAKCGEFTATCQIQVGKAVENISIGAIIGEVGEYIRLRSDVSPSDALNTAVSWESSDNAVVSVNETGLVEFLSAGSATVTATCLGHSASILFEVVNVDATGLRVFPSEIKGKTGDGIYLLALHEPSNTTDKSITWSTSDESVATVDDNGYVTLHAPGNADITASGTSHSATCAVSVDSSTALTAVGADGLTIEFIPGGIRLSNLPELAQIVVTDIAGITVDATIARQSELTIPLLPGVYVVSVNDTTAKILIR